MQFERLTSELVVFCEGVIANYATHNKRNSGSPDSGKANGCGSKSSGITQDANTHGNSSTADGKLGENAPGVVTEGAKQSNEAKPSSSSAEQTALKKYAQDINANDKNTSPKTSEMKITSNSTNTTKPSSEKSSPEPAPAVEEASSSEIFMLRMLSGEEVVLNTEKLLQRNRIHVEERAKAQSALEKELADALEDHRESGRSSGGNTGSCGGDSNSSSSGTSGPSGSSSGNTDGSIAGKRTVEDDTPDENPRPAKMGKFVEEGETQEGLADGGIMSDDRLVLDSDDVLMLAQTNFQFNSSPAGNSDDNANDSVSNDDSDNLFVSAKLVRELALESLNQKQHKERPLPSTRQLLLVNRLTSEELDDNVEIAAHPLRDGDISVAICHLQELNFLKMMKPFEILAHVLNQTDSDATLPPTNEILVINRCAVAEERVIGTAHGSEPPTDREAIWREARRAAKCISEVDNGCDVWEAVIVLNFFSRFWGSWEDFDEQTWRIARWQAVDEDLHGFARSSAIVAGGLCHIVYDLFCEDIKEDPCDPCPRGIKLHGSLLCLLEILAEFTFPSSWELWYPPYHYVEHRPYASTIWRDHKFNPLISWWWHHPRSIPLEYRSRWNDLCYKILKHVERGCRKDGSQKFWISLKQYARSMELSLGSDVDLGWRVFGWEVDQKCVQLRHQLAFLERLMRSITLAFERRGDDCFMAPRICET
jgi:hypothetical protein